MPYRPIEDHGLIGDLYTAALVGKDGTIDWLCLPHFDSPSVFAALLDDEKGGFFSIHPHRGESEITEKQLYWPDTNVLVTHFLTEHGAAELIDFMPCGAARKSVEQHETIRWVSGVRGEIRFRVRCRPAFDYGRAHHETTVLDGGACFQSATLELGLATEVPLRPEGSGVVGEFTLREGESVVFALRQLQGSMDCGSLLSTAEAQWSFRQTVNYWRHWLSQCHYEGRWREMVRRSALALKLLTFEPTGAIVAAPTTSLPEDMGGERNWDYRYTWIRDSAFTLYAFLKLGFTDEAAAYMEFLQRICKQPGEQGPLQLMYGIDGRRELP